MKKLVTLFLTAAFILAMYVPVSAADWNFYGHARVNTFWATDSEEITGTGDDETRLDHDLQGNARIGAIVDAGNIGGRFEYSSAPGLRLLYGTLDMGFGQLLVGQEYTPWSYTGFISTQAYAGDIGMLWFLPYDGRIPMVRLDIDNLTMALVRTRTPNAPNAEVLLPQFQVSYTLPMDGMSMRFAGVFQTYDLDNGDGDTLNAYGLAANFKLAMMGPIYVNFGGFLGQNVGDFGQIGLINMAHTGAPNDVEDTMTWGAATAFGANLGNMRLETGFGFASSDNDNFADDDEARTAYVQATVPLTDTGTAFILPEIGYIDYMDDAAGNDAGDTWYAGLKWQINF